MPKTSSETPDREPQSGPEQRWLAFLAEGRLMLQRDPATGRAVFPPRLRAPGHGGQLTDWQPVSGRGTIHAVTVQYPRPPAHPRVIVLVDLEEGARLLSHMPDVEPENITIGRAVTARILADGDPPIVVFDLAEEGGA